MDPIWAGGYDPRFIKVSKYHPSLLFSVNSFQNSIYIFTIDKDFNAGGYSVLQGAMYYENRRTFAIGKDYVVTTQK